MGDSRGRNERLKQFAKKAKRGSRAVPEWLLVQLAWHIIPRLSRQRVMAIARWSGRRLMKLGGRTRRIIETNLDLVYGPPKDTAARHALIAAIYGSAAQVLLDFFWFAHNTRERVLEYVSTDETVSKAIASDEPAIMVTGHFGSWELAGQTACVNGHPLTSVYAPLGGALTRKRMDEMRTAVGQVLVPREGVVVSLLRALRQGHFIGLLLDQHTPVSAGGMFVDFLGLPATVSGLAALLSIRRKVPIYVVHCRLLKNGHYRVETQGVLSGDHGQDEKEVTQWIADRIGEAILKTPEQWLWRYRRWRYIPPGADPAKFPFYARPFNPEVD